MKSSVQNGRNLSNATVVVLGGSSGLGLATASAAAEEGAKVIIVSGNPSRLEDALSHLPPGCEGYAIDLIEEENIKRLFEKTGPFDHLVYTAGENLALADIATTDVYKAREFFNIRYWGAFAAVKYGSPHINAGGSISLTSGIASSRPGKGWSVASSICGAIEGFTRAMAVELAPVRVNCIKPGVVKTPLWDSMTAEFREQLYSATANSILVKRVGEAEHIARAFLYLMKQPYGTGQCLVIDGGAELV